MNREEVEYDITLSSLAGGSQYAKNNTIAEFTNPLSRSLTLNGEWEVAVKKVSYHNNIVNVHPGQNRIVFTGYRYVSLEEMHKAIYRIFNDIYTVKTRYVFELPAPGSYMNPKTFIETLHNLNCYDSTEKKVISLGELVNFEYLEATQTIQIKDVQRDIKFEGENDVKELTFSPQLASMLGLVWEETNYSCKFKLFSKYVWERKTYKALFLLRHPQVLHKPWNAYMCTFPYSVLWAANYKLYVNVDISSPPVIGNEHVNALLSVPVTQEPNVYTSYEPIHLTYKSITKHTFGAITCRVTDSEGNKIKFLDGSGAFTLQIHLRRVK